MTVASIEESCKALIQAILDVPPDRDTHPLRIQLAKEFIQPGLYRNPEGTVLYAYGPVRQQDCFDVVHAYTVTLRFKEGPHEDELVTIGLFGPDGFFAYQKV